MKIISTAPKTWSYNRLDGFIEELEAGVSVNSSEQEGDPAVRILKTSCVTLGRFDPTEAKPVLVAERSRVTCPVKQGRIVISRMNTPDLVGASAYIAQDYKGLFLPDRLWQTVWRTNIRFDPRWLAQLLVSSYGRVFLKSIASGTSDTMKNISKESFLAAQAPTPPLPEQQKIADILGTWDEALEKLDALIAAKARRKQALMQQLLFGKRRLPGQKMHWQMRTLGDLLEPIIRTVPKPSGAFLAAGIRSHGKGVFMKPAFEPDGIALDELFEISTDDLIVNITFAWEGAAAIVPPAANGALVSHRFPTFRVRESDAALSFLRHYILTKQFVFNCGLASPGGAGRNRVLSKNGFLAIEVSVPGAPEQKLIGDILDTADAELRLLRQQRTALDQQKRGLMQQLLTGQIRTTPTIQ